MPAGKSTDQKRKVGRPDRPVLTLLRGRRTFNMERIREKKIQHGQAFELYSVYQSKVCESLVEVGSYMGIRDPQYNQYVVRQLKFLWGKHGQ